MQYQYWWTTLHWHQTNNHLNFQRQAKVTTSSRLHKYTEIIIKKAEFQAFLKSWQQLTVTAAGGPTQPT